MNEPPKITTPSAGPPKPVGLRPEERLVSSIEIIGSLFNEINGKAGAPAALPEPTGLTILDRLDSAEAIIKDLYTVKNQRQQDDPPAAITQAPAPPKKEGSSGVIVHRSSNATITRYPGRNSAPSAAKPRNPALSESPPTEVIRMKNGATITRYPTGKSSFQNDATTLPAAPDDCLTKEWPALKIERKRWRSAGRHSARLLEGKRIGDSKRKASSQKSRCAHRFRREITW